MNNILNEYDAHAPAAGHSLANGSLVNGAQSHVAPHVSSHQGKYNDPVSNFFLYFNQRTGRDTLFSGYTAGHIANSPHLTRNSIAVDFGCGTGWMALNLADNFSRVYGIDTSLSMLKIAKEQKVAEEKATNRDIAVMFHQKPPDDIKGKCDFVIAFHVHYHFDTAKKLKEEFFEAAASLLKPKGELLLIGCPSDHIRRSPDHYTNHVRVEDIPAETLRMSSQVDNLLADSDGFVALKDIPPFALPDGTQMKVTFKIGSDHGAETREISLIDTFWSDSALVRTASEAGLSIAQRTNLRCLNHSNAYEAMHFRKLPDRQP
jgi:SAM-dependent methyltransferase